MKPSIVVTPDCSEANVPEFHEGIRGFLLSRQRVADVITLHHFENDGWLVPRLRRPGVRSNKCKNTEFVRFVRKAAVRSAYFKGKKRRPVEGLEPV
jgi:hypothetical protein